MWDRRNYDWIMFSLTSPMVFTGVQTHNFVFTKPTLYALDNSSFQYSSHYDFVENFNKMQYAEMLTQD